MEIAKIVTEDARLMEFARRARKEPTPAEAAVWQLLRGRKLGGLRFRRQHVLHGYVVDLYCHERRLCIELDGAPHMDPVQAQRDASRDADLSLRGYRILRMWNQDVLNDLPAFRLRLLDAASTPGQVPPL